MSWKNSKFEIFWQKTSQETSRKISQKTSQRIRRRGRLMLHLEQLETRLTPSVVTVPLDPAHDQFGDQIVTVQSYGDPNHAAFSFFDSGASAITFSAAEQAALASQGFAIPILNPGGAVAQGLGGGPLSLGGLITGDVSRPGTILADGLHAASMTFNPGPTGSP